MVKNRKMSNQKNELQITWQKRLELRAEANKFRAEGYKFRTEGDRLRAKGDRLYAEGDKFRAEGDVLFFTAVINQYGKDAVVELNEKGCQIKPLITINFE